MNIGGEKYLFFINMIFVVLLPLAFFLNACSLTVQEDPCLNCENVVHKGFLHEEGGEYYSGATIIDTLKSSSQKIYYTISTTYPLFPGKTEEQMVGTPSTLGCGCPVSDPVVWLNQDIIVDGDTIKANTNLFSDSIKSRVGDTVGSFDAIRFKDNVVFKSGINLLFMETSLMNRTDTVRFYVPDSIGF